MSVELAWTAGFMDGEGCIVVGANGSLQVRIINTSLRSLERVKAAVGCGVIKPRKQIVNKPQYYWSCYGEDAQRVLGELAPYLTAKLEQAVTGFEYYDTIKSWPKTRENVSIRKAFVDMTRAKLTTMKFND